MLRPFAIKIAVLSGVAKDIARLAFPSRLGMFPVRVFLHSTSSTLISLSETGYNPQESIVNQESIPNLYLQCSQT
jgi:hypothetical protein